MVVSRQQVCEREPAGAPTQAGRGRAGQGSAGQDRAGPARLQCKPRTRSQYSTTQAASPVISHSHLLLLKEHAARQRVCTYFNFWGTKISNGPFRNSFNMMEITD